MSHEPENPFAAGYMLQLRQADGVAEDLKRQLQAAQEEIARLREACHTKHRDFGKLEMEWSQARTERDTSLAELSAERAKHEKLLSECERILPKAERHIDSIPALQAALDAERAAHAETRRRAVSLDAYLEAARVRLDAENAAHAETKAKLDAMREDRDLWQEHAEDGGPCPAFAKLETIRKRANDCMYSLDAWLDWEQEASELRARLASVGDSLATRGIDWPTWEARVRDAARRDALKEVREMFHVEAERGPADMTFREFCLWMSGRIRALAGDKP